MSNLKTFFISYKYHFLLLLAGLVWIGLYNHFLQASIQTFITPDARSYRISAENLYLHQRGHAFRPILMAIINGIPYLFGGADADLYAFSDWVNLSCWLGSLLVLLEILNTFLKPKIAFFFALSSVFIIGLSSQLFLMETECIYVFFILSGFYFLIRYNETKTYKFLAFGLAFFILSMLIKPGSLMLALLLTLFFIKVISNNYKSKFSLLLYGSYALVLVQCAGIKYQFGNFTISYVDAVTYYDYLGARAEALQKDVPFDDVWKSRGKYIYSLDGPKQKEVAAEDFKSQLTSNTTNFMEAYATDVFENATTGSAAVKHLEIIKVKDYFRFFKTLVYRMSEWQNRVLSLIGFLLGLYFFSKIKRPEYQLALIGFFVLYIIVLSGISCREGDRFHVVTFPFVIVLAAKFVAQKRTAFRKN